MHAEMLRSPGHTKVHVIAQNAGLTMVVTAGKREIPRLHAEVLWVTGIPKSTSALDI